MISNDRELLTAVDLYNEAQAVHSTALIKLSEAMENEKRASELVVRSKLALDEQIFARRPLA
jgi:hypothetical protein